MKKLSTIGLTLLLLISALGLLNINSDFTAQAGGTQVNAVSGASISTGETEETAGSAITVVTGSAITVVTGSAIYVNIDELSSYEEIEELAKSENRFYDISSIVLKLDGEAEVYEAKIAFDKLYKSKNAVHIYKVHLDIYNYSTIEVESDTGKYRDNIENIFWMLYDKNGSLGNIILDENMKSLNGKSKFVVENIQYKEHEPTGSAILWQASKPTNQGYKRLAANSINILGGHTHTEDCYRGDLHIHEGINCEYEKGEILLGYNSSGEVYLSKDGVNWNHILTTRYWIRGLIYGNGKFVLDLDGGGAGTILTSEDGYNWQEYIPKTTIDGDVYYIRPKFCVDGVFYGEAGTKDGGRTSHYLIKSTDGISWVELSRFLHQTQSGNNGMVYSKYNGKTYIYVGATAWIRVYEVQEDGSVISANYKEFPSSSFKMFQLGNYVVVREALEGGYSIKYRYVYGDYKLASSSTEGYREGAFGNNKYLILTGEGILKTGESVESLTSVKGHNLSIKDSVKMLYHANKFIVYKDSSLTMSVDCINWTAPTSLPSPLTITSNSDEEGVIDKGNCLKEGKYYDTGGEEVSPICHTVVKSIVETKPTQNIYWGQSIITTATATYLDGHTATVNLTTDFNNKVLGTRSEILRYTGLVNNAKTNGEIKNPVSVTVKDYIIDIKAESPEQIVIYKGGINNNLKIKKASTGNIEHTVSSTSNNYTSTKVGEQTVRLNYGGLTTINGEYLYCDIKVTVQAGLDRIEPVLDIQSVYKGIRPNLKVVAYYMDGTEKTVESISNFNPDIFTQQTVTLSYTDQGATKTTTCKVTVLNYPISIDLSLEKYEVFQGEKLKIKTLEIIMADDSVISDSSKIIHEGFNKDILGTQIVTFSYSFNGKTVKKDVNIYIKPDLESITVDNNNVILYRGQTPNIVVTAHYNTKESKILNTEEYTIKGFDKNLYDRKSKSYIISYMYKGVTKTLPINIVVLPNVSKIEAIAFRELNEGEDIDVKINVMYEDGLTIEKRPVDEGITITGYNPSTIGFQTVSIYYSEGGFTKSCSVIVRVRATIKVDISTSMLVALNSNTGEITQSGIELNSLTREAIKIEINKITPIETNTLMDVSPYKFPRWSNLGRGDSRSIAIGLKSVGGNWVTNSLQTPLWVVDATGKKDVGILQASDGITSKKANIAIVANFGTSIAQNESLKYTITWSIRLAED